MSLAGTLDLTIEQGATFQKIMTWMDSAKQPVDNTGYSARMQIRTKLGGPITIELTTGNGRIILGGADGKITLLIDATDTDAMSWTGNQVYDLELESGSGFVRRLLEGKVKLNLNVTV